MAITWYRLNTIACISEVGKLRSDQFTRSLVGYRHKAYTKFCHLQEARGNIGQLQRNLLKSTILRDHLNIFFWNSEAFSASPILYIFGIRILNKAHLSTTDEFSNRYE